VRPGAEVKRGSVLATLDCRNTSAESREVAMRARALEARQAAIAKETGRVAGLLDGGFVSPNEVEQKQAETASMEAQFAAAKAKLASSSLEVGDCALKAPFDGEVSDRFIDPGAFVRPGQPIVAVVDRSTVRVVADVPERDHDAVAPGTALRVKLLSTGKELPGKVARRSPSADRGTRTIRFEVDLADPERVMPVGTTAEVRVEVGEPAAAVRVPLAAATVRGGKASVFTIVDGVAHAVTVAIKGEDAGDLFLDAAALPAGSMVVLEGRALLADGDRVEAKDAPAPATAPAVVEPIPLSSAIPSTTPAAAKGVR
jgi:RND family efflux transporter MFP subunit